MSAKSLKGSRPLVAVPTCHQVIGDLDYYCTQHKYIAALHRCAAVLPLQLPLLGDELDIDALFARIDGILLTGSHSNIHPKRYTSTDPAVDFKLDERRDATVIPLLRPAIETGIPLLAICRGFQELNVAYGGELSPHLHEEGGDIEHREIKDLPLEERYERGHRVKLVAGGLLHQIVGEESVEVNTLHEQGIKRLGPGLSAEGHAEDGLIEAVSVDGSPGFALGVQWHPEWKAWEDRVSQKLFSAFGRACAAYAERTGAASATQTRRPAS